MISLSSHNSDLDVIREKIKSLREDQHHLAWRIRFQQELLTDKSYAKMVQEQDEIIAKAFDYKQHLAISRAKAEPMIQELNILSLQKDEEIYELECKAEEIKGMARVAKNPKAKQSEKTLTATEKYNAFLALIPKEIQEQLGSEKLQKLYESSK